MDPLSFIFGIALMGAVLSDQQPKKKPTFRLVRMDPREQGFNARAMMQAQARGKPYDLHKIIAVEVEIAADEATPLLTAAARRFAIAEGRRWLPTAKRARRITHPYPRFNEQRAKFEVE